MIALPRTMANCCTKAWFVSHPCRPAANDGRARSERGRHSLTISWRDETTSSACRGHSSPSPLCSPPEDMGRGPPEVRSKVTLSQSQSRISQLSPVPRHTSQRGPDDCCCAGPARRNPLRIAYELSWCASCYQSTRSEASSTCCVVACCLDTHRRWAAVPANATHSSIVRRPG
jgi:hypothetical protein